MKVTKAQINQLKAIDEAMMYIHATDMLLYKSFNEKFYEAHLEPVCKVVYKLRELWFSTLTGEKSFDDFYHQFGSPGLPNGKPIAWDEKGISPNGGGYIPDRMGEIILNQDWSFEMRVRLVWKLYEKCDKIRKNHVSKK